MLLKTRPLFALYVLDAMKELNKSIDDGITVGILLAVKNKIIEQKLQFGSSKGLYGQMALLHSPVLNSYVNDRDLMNHPQSIHESTIDSSFSIGDSVSLVTSRRCAAEELQPNNNRVEGHLNKKRRSIIEKLEDQREFCIRHHFGELKLPAVGKDSSIVSLVWKEDFAKPYLKIEKPNQVPEPPTKNLKISILDQRKRLID